MVNALSYRTNSVDENIVYGCVDDPHIPELEDIVYSDDDEDVGAEADKNNLDAFMPVSPIPTTRIHKDHSVEQIIGDLNSTPQTRRMIKNLKEHEAMQEGLLKFKLQPDFDKIDLLMRKRAISTNMGVPEQKEERGQVTAQDSEIASLKKRVKKLERRNKSRTLGLKRLRKVGSARRLDSSEDEGLGDQEDAYKQGRKIADIDADAEVTLIDET
ncbi:hypothetical protein Tco_0426119 [Tanacetum coccineum]